MKIELDRTVILHCDDWAGDYVVEGEFKILSKSWKNPRFCTFNKELRKWETSNEWYQRKRWEYKNEPS